MHSSRIFSFDFINFNDYNGNVSICYAINYEISIGQNLKMGFAKSISNFGSIIYGVSFTDAS